MNSCFSPERAVRAENPATSRVPIRPACPTCAWSKNRLPKPRHKPIGESIRGVKAEGQEIPQRDHEEMAEDIPRLWAMCCAWFAVGEGLSCHQDVRADRRFRRLRIIGGFAECASSKYLIVPSGPVAELVDAPDLKSVDPKGSCLFESDRGHHQFKDLTSPKLAPYIGTHSLCLSIVSDSLPPRSTWVPQPRIIRTGRVHCDNRRTSRLEKGVFGASSARRNLCAIRQCAAAGSPSAATARKVVGGRA